MEMQDIARQALRIHTYPKQASVLMSAVYTVHKNLLEYAESHKDLRPKPILDVVAWADNHPVYHYAMHRMMNILCPKRDSSYYQLEACVKDLANLE